MPKLMLATSNPGKVAEFRALLSRHIDISGVSLLTPNDWPQPLPAIAETGETFAANARLKALGLAAATGLVALADDSGLCVDALNGEPGLHSARWAGEAATDADRTRLLLERLRSVPDEARTARFVCAIAVALPNGQCFGTEGICEGLILNAPRGANGFGYDPIFLLPDFGRTMAELSSAEKNRVSHRAITLAALVPHLTQILPPGIKTVSSFY